MKRIISNVAKDIIDGNFEISDDARERLEELKEQRFKRDIDRHVTKGN